MTATIHQITTPLNQRRHANEQMNQRMMDLHITDPHTRSFAVPDCPCGCWEEMLAKGGVA